MRAFLTCLGWLGALLAGGSAAHAEEPTPEERAFFEVRVEPAEVVVGQRVRVTLRLLYEEEFFRSHAATLFRQPLDLEVQATAPWLEALDGAVLVPPILGLADGGPRVYVRVVFDGAVTSLRFTEAEERGGRRYAVLRATRTLIAKRAGPLVLAAPTLRYAYAETIEENLLGERTAATTRPVLIRGQPTTIDIVEPPAEGRPAGFAGAVGRYTLEARVEDAAVTVGASFGITLLISGEGNLGLIAQPRFPDLDGFHVYGAREAPSDDPAPGRRVITYDVAVTDPAIEAVPALPFVFYDPERGYQTVRSAPVRLAVGGGADPTLLPENDAAIGRERGSTSFVWLVGILAALVLLPLTILAGVVAVRRRRRQHASAAPREHPARSAALAAAKVALRASLQGSADVTMASYVAYLAALLDCGPGAVVGPGLAPRLRAAGAPEALIAQAGNAMDALVVERYGGPSRAVLDDALVVRLHETLAGALG